MNWLRSLQKYQVINIQQILIVICSGLLMGFSPAPINLWGLSWFALAPLWWLITQEKNNTLQVTFLGFTWGFSFHSLALFWITGVHPMTWMGVPWLASLFIAIAVWLIISIWGGLFVTLWVLIFNFIHRKFIKDNHDRFFLLTFTRVIIGVTIWCLLETLWSHTPLWWSSLSYTQSPNNLIILQLVKLSGFNTVTAAIVAVNALLGEAIFLSRLSKKDRIILSSQTQKIIFSLPIVLCLSLHLLGWFIYQQPMENKNLQPIKIGIVQGNIPNEIKLFSEGWKKAISGYTEGYRRLAKQGVDIVLTPETALPFYWKDITNNSDIYRAVLQEKVPIWLGAYGRQEKSYTNSLFTLTQEGKTYSQYDKTILVPLGEYIPFEPIIGKIINRLSPLDAHLAAGKKRQILNTPFGKAIVGICYESAFAEHFRYQTKAGGEFMITASNNAHYSAAMPAQHHAQDIIRAIESDRWMARATNTGYSAFVDPHGNTLWRSQIDKYQIYSQTIYRRQTKTLYVRYGDWLTVLLLVLSIFAIAITLISRWANILTFG